MSSAPKNGLTRKAGVAAVGVALLSSLLLSACSSPASQTNDSAPNPTGSSSASASAAPQGVTKFKSAAFDLSKQVSIDVKNNDSNILLSNGVISGEFPTDGAQSVSFKAYEKDAAWKYNVQERLESANFTLMHWKDKTYVVVKGWTRKSTPASGMQAAQNTTAQAVIVLNMDNGQEVKVFKSVEAPLGGESDTTYFLDMPDGSAHSGMEADYIYKTFMVGLTYRNGEGHEKLVDPLTGADIAVYDKQRAPQTLLNNEAGFYEYAYSTVMNSDGVPKAAATFGNYALVVTSQPDVKSKTGAYIQNSKYALVNTLTKSTVSEVVCINRASIMNSDNVSYSPNYRYVNFGNVVFDTQSKAAFCATPLDENVRKVFVNDVDNDGNMYAAADRQYLKLNIADTSKVETLVEDYSFAKDELPVLITDKGSALFYSENSKDTLVAVPAK